MIVVYDSLLHFTAVVSVLLSSLAGDCYFASRDRSCVHTRQVAVLFCVKWRYGSHLDSVTTVRSTRKYESRKLMPIYLTIVSNFFQIGCEKTEPRLVEDGPVAQQQEEKDNNNKMTSDTRSVPDPSKTTALVTVLTCLRTLSC